MVRKITPTAGGWGKRSGIADNHRHLEQSASRVLAAAPWSRDAWRDEFCENIADSILRRRSLPRAICVSVRETIAEIVRLETNALQMPRSPPANSVEAVAHRSRQRALVAFSANTDELVQEWSDGLEKILRRILDAVPRNLSHDQFPFTVPLIDLMPNSLEIVGNLVAQLLRFSEDDPFTIRPGSVLAESTKHALLRFNKIADDVARKNPHRLTSPQQSGLTGMALVKTFLVDTPFLNLLVTPVPFCIPRKKWASHGVAIAPPNFGKTQLVSAIAKSFIDQPDPPALFILDPHGDMFKNVLRLDVFHPRHGRLRDRVLILDPADPNGPPRLSFLDYGDTTETGAARAFNFLLASMSSEWSPKQATAAAYMLRLLRLIPGASLDTLRQLVDDDARSASTSVFSHAIHALPDVERDFFLHQFFDNRMRDTKQAMGWKIYNLMASETFRTIFSATYNSFDAEQCIQDKKIVIVNGGEEKLGPEGMATFLQFIVGQFYAASFKRAKIPEDQRHLALMFIDEAHYVFNNALIKSILTECRKFSCGIFAATQLIEQMTPEVKAAVYGATAIRFAGPVSHGDAASLGREMFTDADFIRSMKSVERSHSEWAVQVEGLTDKCAIHVTLPFGMLERAPTMSRPDIENLRALNYARLTAASQRPPARSPTNLASNSAPTPPPLTPPPIPHPPRTPWNSDHGDPEEV